MCFGRSKTWMSSNLSFPFGSAGSKLERRLNTPHFQSRTMVRTMRKVGTVAYSTVSSMEEEVVVVGISKQSKLGAGVVVLVLDVEVVACSTKA